MAMFLFSKGKLIAIFCTNVTLFCLTLKYDQSLSLAIFDNSLSYFPEESIRQIICGDGEVLKFEW